MKNISYDGTSYFLNKLLLSSLLYSKFNPIVHYFNLIFQNYYYYINCDLINYKITRNL